MPSVIFLHFHKGRTELEILHGKSNCRKSKSTWCCNNLAIINKWHRRRQGGLYEIEERLKLRDVFVREKLFWRDREKGLGHIFFFFFFDKWYTSWKFFLEIICKNRKTKQVIAIARLQTCSKKKTFHKLPESEIFSQKIECGGRNKHIQKRKQQSDGERRDSARPGRTFKKLNKYLLSRYIYNPRASIRTIPKEGWSCLKTGLLQSPRKNNTRFLFFSFFSFFFFFLVLTVAYYYYIMRISMKMTQYEENTRSTQSYQTTIDYWKKRAGGRWSTCIRGSSIDSTDQLIPTTQKHSGVTKIVHCISTKESSPSFLLNCFSLQIFFSPDNIT